MRHSPAALGGVALGLLLLIQTGAHADLIHWTYSWSNSPTSVLPDVPSSGGSVTLTNVGPTPVTGDTTIVATSIQTNHDPSPTSSPDNYTHAAYSLQLSVTDSSGASGSLTFKGELNGTVTASSSNLTNTFTNQTTQTLLLGDHLYTVTIGDFTKPGPPGSTASGAISAQAVITVQTLPEPGTLALASVGVLGLVGTLWRRRRAPLLEAG
jgi:hypothetical protein